MNLFTHVYVLCLCREMTWWSTLMSNLRVSASLLMGGWNLMGPAVWSLQSYLVTWAALRPWFVFWSQYAQTITKHPMKGMLTGPATILNWSFVRNNQSRYLNNYPCTIPLQLYLTEIYQVQSWSAMMLLALWRSCDSTHFLSTWARRIAKFKACFLIALCTRIKLALQTKLGHWKLQVRNMLPDCFGYEGMRWRILRLEE